jgi:post-segregation antitoxin (ccd killing protein)
VPLPPYDPNARRKTISVTINADLAAKAVPAGINLARTAEAAIPVAFTELERGRVKADIAVAVRITDAYVAQHGHPSSDWLSNFEPENPAQLLRNAVGTVSHVRFESARGLDRLFSGI